MIDENFNLTLYIAVTRYHMHLPLLLMTIKEQVKTQSEKQEAMR